MPANKGGDSKQGLIITLVCFILLSIILGVTTYYGYAEQEALRAAANKEKGAAADMQKNRDWYKFVALQMKAYTGDLKKQETEDWKVARERYNNNQLSGDGTEKADVVALISDLDSRVGNEPYRMKVARLEEALQNAQTSLQNEKNALAKERADHKRLVDVKDAELQEAHKQLEQAQAKNIEIQKKMAQDLVTGLQQFGATSEELAKLQKQAATEKGNLEKERSRLRAEIKDQEEARKKLELKLTPPDLQKFSTPKGKIVSVDPGSQLARINLGSLDNVRSQQGLTFSIFGHGISGRGTNERKGALELVDVLGPHLSLARITETVDARNHPIEPGDVLVNPAWSPTMQEHVAIAGLIDLAGDGRDHIDELMRALQKQNVVVDAYLDLKEATVKGKMTLKTDYLIVGEPPEFSGDLSIREGDTRFERKTEIMDKMSGMQVEAQRLGVTVVPLRRFVVQTGYQVPQGARSTSGFSYESRIPSSPATGEPKAQPGKKEKVKEEKKDEDK
jgi:hypothetical protein